MDNFWDLRYSEPGFAYGMEPNEFFRKEIDGLLPGKLLLPGEGEGRNAVYAAGLGWEVHAFDQSSVAKSKALAWAGSLGLNIDYQQMDIDRLECEKPKFDLVALLFVHFPPHERQSLHRRFANCLKPKKMILLESFHKSQLSFSTGGPRSAEMLYREEDLMEDFSSLDIRLCEQGLREVLEGRYHTGISSTIRFKAINTTK
jgi:SAM-dependent methyltransferase